MKTTGKGIVTALRTVMIHGAACCLLPAFLACGQTGGPRELKLSLILGENSDWYRGAARFAELIAERTDGAYRVRIYPHAQLAGQVQRTELEMLQSGVIDLSLESSILLSLIEPKMSVLSMPWLFDGYDEANRVLDGEPGQRLLDALPPKGIVGLAYGANGFRQLTNSRRPVRTPGDIAGLKIRVPGIKLYIDVFRRMGADPSSMNFGEVFTALAQGTFDGQENPLSVIHSSRLYEVQKYLTLWDYSYDPVILCINGGLWDSLPPEMRDVFRSCAREAMEYQRELVAGGEDALADTLRGLGMDITRLNEREREAFAPLVEPLYGDYESVIGAETLSRFREAVQ